MTREEARKRLEVYLICAQCPEDKECYDSSLHSTCEYNDCREEVSLAEAIRTAIKALEQEPILDKIRAEIEEQIIPRSSYTDKQKKQVIEIIDKYRGYSPCDDCEHEGSFGKEFDDTCMQCKSGSNRTESR